MRMNRDSIARALNHHQRVGNIWGWRLSGFDGPERYYVRLVDNEEIACSYNQVKFLVAGLASADLAHGRAAAKAANAETHKAVTA